jgi:hypothetical protein
MPARSPVLGNHHRQWANSRTLENNALGFEGGLESNSSSPLTLSTSVTQTLSIEGYQVRQNLLTFSSSGISLTNQGPTQ